MMVTPDVMATLADWSGMVVMLLGLLYCGWYLATLPSAPWYVGGTRHRPLPARRENCRGHKDG